LSSDWVSLYFFVCRIFLNLVLYQGFLFLTASNFH
jgi:hypothetical protein